MSAKKKPAAVKWNGLWATLKKVAVGIDTWSGEHYVDGYAIVYQVTERRGDVIRDRIETGPAIYCDSLTAADVRVWSIYRLAHDHLAEAASRLRRKVKP